MTRTVGPSTPRTFKRNASWVLSSNLLYGASQWGVLVVLARFGTPSIVGDFALGLAIAAPIDMFARLQLRSIFVTDASRRYPVGIYFSLRFLMAMLGLLTTIVVALVAGYQATTLSTVMAVALAKGIESISDILNGYLQLYDQMIRMSWSLILRSVFAPAAVLVPVVLFKNAAASALGLAAIWVAVLLFYDIPTARKVAIKAVPRAERIQLVWKTTLLQHLFLLAVPLGVVSALGSLRVNLPRYVVEGRLGVEMLGIFAALGYLMVIGGRIVQSLMQVTLPGMGRAFARGDIREFRRMVSVQAGGALALGLASVGVAALAGAIILRILYGEVYAAYNILFIALMGAATLEYVATVLQLSLTAAREVRVQAWIRMLAVVVVGVISLFCIPHWGLLGAASALAAGSAVDLAGALLVMMRVTRAARPAVPPHSRVVS